MTSCCLGGVKRASFVMGEVCLRSKVGEVGEARIGKEELGHEHA